MLDDEFSDADLSDADTMEPWEMVTQLDIDALDARLTVLEQHWRIH